MCSIQVTEMQETESRTVKEFIDRGWNGAGMQTNREIRIAFDKTCYFCDGTENLRAHHVDLVGAHLNKSANNGLGNLVTLCHKCHCRLHVLLQPEKFKYVVKAKDAQRIADIVTRRTAGMTLEQIGAECGLSRQRILQILKANVPADQLLPLKDHTRRIIRGKAARFIESRFARPLRDVLTEYYKALGSVDRTAQALGVTRGRVNYWMKVCDIPRDKGPRPWWFTPQLPASHIDIKEL